MAVIEVNNIKKKYKTVTAVKGISFTVQAGEVFGFLGPNGAGKSTTINILCTLVKPTAGKAAINGYNVITQPQEVRASIGIVFQDPSLDERLTAYENLLFHALIYNVPASDREKRITKVLKMVELYPRQHELVRTFSGGMKRRLEIARGLLHYPKVLFLDEPTLGLDPQTRRRMWDYIKELKEKEGITIFLTTHYMDEAENCDRIAIIDYGEIIALDTPLKLKQLVGGDVISVTTDKQEQLEKELKTRFQLAVFQENGRLFFEVKNGETFLPEFIKSLKTPLNSISVRQPTLDDVFLKLTGRTIREESGDTFGAIRAHLRARGR